MENSIIGNRWKILEWIGAGGMGKIYKIQDIKTGEIQAIKILPGVGHQNKIAVWRFKREFRILSKMNHRNIVKVFDYGREQDFLFFTMELVDGWRCDQFVEKLMDKDEDRNSFVIREMENYLRRMIKVFNTLDYIHKKGVVHRDIKPQNIMFVGEDEIKLMDFGLTADLQANVAITNPGILIGTFAYMAPEQSQGLRIDHRVDLYSMGVLLYEHFAGCPLFAYDNPMAFLKRQLESRPVLPRTYNPGIPLLLEKIIMKLLEKDPSKRFLTASEGASALELVLSGEDRHLSTVLQDFSLQVKPEFIGREKEIGILSDALEESVRKKGKFGLIGGEAGIGKTRLMDQLRELFIIKNFGFLKGNCYEREGIYYQPFVEILRSGLDLVQGSKSAFVEKIVNECGIELVKLLPELFENSFVKENCSSESLGEKGDKLRLFDAVYRFLAAISKEMPLCVLIDDLHWADELTIEMLHYIVRNVKNEHILIVSNYRIEEILSQSLQSLISDFLRKGNLDFQIQLQRLNREETCSLITGFFRQTGISKELVTLIYERTDGNPYFINEMLKSLKENNLIEIVNDVLDFKNFESLDIPSGIRDLVERRLNRLPENMKQVLSAASVLGVQFEFEHLMDLAEINENELFDFMDEFVRYKLVEETETQGQGDYYQFVHPMIREVLYKDMNKRRRRRYHERAAELLEKNCTGDTEKYAEELVRHFGEAGENSRVLEYAKIAGKKSDKLYANEAATRYLTMALDLTKSREEQANVKDEIELVQSLFRISSRIGNVDVSLKYIDELQRLASVAGGDQNLLVETYRSKGRFLEKQGKLDQAENCYNQALETLGANALDTEQGAFLLAHFSWLNFLRGDYLQALEHGSRGYDIMKSIKNDRSRIPFLNLLGVLHLHLSEYKKSEECFREALDIALKENVLIHVADIYNNLGVMHTERLDYSRACECYDKAFEISGKIGNLYAESLYYSNKGALEFELGETANAHELGEKGVKLATRIGDSRSYASNLLVLGMVNVRKGNWEQAINYLNESLKYCQDLQETVKIIDCMLQRGEIARQREHWDDALSFGLSAESIGMRHQVREKQIDTYLFIIKIYLESNDLQRASIYIQKSKNLISQYNIQRIEKELCWLEGKYFKKKNKYLQAEEKYREAFEFFKEYPGVEKKAEFLINYSYFNMLSHSMNEVEKQKITELLEDVSATLVKCQSIIFLKKAQDMLASLEAGFYTGLKPKTRLNIHQSCPDFVFIGRDSEKELCFSWMEKTHEMKKCLFISFRGETGIGKSCLLSELNNMARELAIPCFHCRCSKELKGNPYSLFNGIVEQFFQFYAEILDKKELEAFKSSILPVFIHTWSGLRKYSPFKKIKRIYPLPPTEEVRRIFDTFYNFFKIISSKHAMVITMDDLHYSDEASLDLLHFLIRQAKDDKILLVATSNPEDSSSYPENAFASFEKSLIRDSLVVRKELTDLEHEDTNSLIGQILKDGGVNDQIRETVWEKAGGNPLFVKELLHSLIKDHSIYLDTENSIWKETAPLNTITAPDEIVDTLKKRFENLSPESYKCLRIASTIGHEFDFDLLIKVTGLEEDKLIDCIDELMIKGIIKDVKDPAGLRDRYCFTQGKFKYILYESLDEEYAREIQTKIGISIEQLYFDRLEEISGELAYHFVNGNIPEKAVEYSFQAGIRAKKIFANFEALMNFENALLVIEKAPSLFRYKTKLDVLINLGELYSITGRWNESLARFSEALRVSQTNHDIEMESSLYIRLGQHFQLKGMNVEALSSFTNAKNLADLKKDSENTSEIFCNLGKIYYQMGDLEKAEDYFSKAVDIGLNFEDEHAIGQGYNGLGGIYWRLGNWDNALSYWERALEINQDLGNKREIGFIFNNLARIQISRGDTSKALESSNNAHRIFEEIGDTEGYLNVQSTIAAVNRLKGDWKTYENIIMKVMELSAQFGLKHLEVETMCSYGQYLIYSGNLEAANKILDECLEKAKSIDAYSSVVEVNINLAKLNEITDEFNEAKQLLNNALAIVREKNLGGFKTQILLSLAELLLRTGEIRNAGEYLSLAEQSGNNQNSNILSASISFLKGRFEEACGYKNEAHRLYQIALNIYMDSGFVYEAANVMFYLGQFFLNHDENYDIAHENLVHAMGLFQQLGAVAEMKKCEETILKLKSGATQTSTLSLDQMHNGNPLQ